MLEPELLEVEPLLEPELLFAPELLLEVEPLLEPWLALVWSTIVPVTVGLALCGVRVTVFPETQYEYCGPPEDSEITLFEVV